MKLDGFSLWSTYSRLWSTWFQFMIYMVSVYDLHKKASRSRVYPPNLCRSLIETIPKGKKLKKLKSGPLIYMFLPKKGDVDHELPLWWFTLTIYIVFFLCVCVFFWCFLCLVVGFVLVWVLEGLGWCGASNLTLPFLEVGFCFVCLLVLCCVAESNISTEQKHKQETLVLQCVLAWFHDRGLPKRKAEKKKE